MKYVDYYESPLGRIRLCAEGEFLTELLFVGQKGYREVSEGEAALKPVPVLERTKSWLDEYFAGKRPDTAPKLLLKGTEFQLSVWKLLQEIPYGRTVTYGAIAEKLAKKRGLERMSARAVGNAVGKNPVLIIIPCHRVIGSDGSLTGFAAGTERKRRLLEAENTSLL